MRAILLRLVALLAAFLLLDRSVAWLYTKVILPRALSGEAGGAINRLLTKEHDIDFLILGTSRAKHQLDPAKLTTLGDRGWNAGANRVGGLWYSAVVLDLALREGLRPKTVIVQADPQLFRGGTEAAEARLESLRALYPFLDRSPLLARYARETGFRERTLLRLRSYRYNGKALNLLLHGIRAREDSGNGFEPLNGSPGSVEPALPESAPVAPDSAALSVIDDLAARARRHDIRLAVVLPPYFAECDCGPPREALREALQARGAEVLDFGDLGAPGKVLGDPSLWRDAAHLSGEGAGKLSGVLNTLLGSK